MTVGICTGTRSVFGRISGKRIFDYRTCPGVSTEDQDFDTKPRILLPCEFIDIIDVPKDIDTEKTKKINKRRKRNVSVY